MKILQPSKLEIDSEAIVSEQLGGFYASTWAYDCANDFSWLVVSVNEVCRVESTIGEGRCFMRWPQVTKKM